MTDIATPTLSPASLPLANSLAHLVLAAGEVFAIEPIRGMRLWNLMCATPLDAHLRMHREQNLVLAVIAAQRGESAEVVHISPESRGDWGGVHNGKRMMSEDGNGKPYPMDGGVALLRCVGPMSKEVSSFDRGCSTVDLRKSVRTARVDKDVKTVAMRFDSPGGTVAGNDDLAQDVRRLAAEKPTYAYVDDCCCSAAYYVASQCNAIYANRSAVIGSISTLMVLMDMSKMAEAMGVEVIVLAPDEATFKGTGAPGAPITEPQRAYLKGIVTDFAKQFHSSVQRGRGLSDEQMKAVTDGRAFTATTARSLGLIDGITTYDSVIAKLKTYKPPTS